ncbi:MAG: hypothetical protein ACI9UR_002421 [Bacteroidia bacterium]|jgi:uncharacterized protein YbjT (DUF2867 family)
MKVLLTGATGYIGKRLLPVLLDAGHTVVCAVRDKGRFPKTGIYSNPRISVLEIDFLEENTEIRIDADVEAAYYLVHSMSASTSDFESLEAKSAENFVQLMEQTTCKQIIYLGGIANKEELSKHLSSRQRVEQILRTSNGAVTALKAGIIVGSGSASFEIMRDLVEKLPVMVTPQWLNTKSHPIAIRNVLQFLSGVLGRADTYNKSFDIAGPEVLTYKEMLLQFSEVRGLSRYIFTVPVMTPRVSSYWLYFVTATSYKLAVNLVDSMKIEVIAKPNDLAQKLNIELIKYQGAVERAFQRIEQNNVVSSWKDALASSFDENTLRTYINVPSNGCFVDDRKAVFTRNADEIKDNIWSIGGERGWYYGNLLWRIRGFMDKLFGGVGLRRGRRSPSDIVAGEAIDFWRVLLADKEEGRLLLYAEMKLPGEAWLELKIETNGEQTSLRQTATFRPKGLLGRLYWYSVLPFHFFVFEGMLQNIANFKA